MFTPLTFANFGSQTLFVGAAGFGKAAVYLGGALLLGGVSQMLTPVPDAPSEETPNSFQFNSPINTSIAGLPVPILFGERIVGSVVISAGINVVRN